MNYRQPFKGTFPITQDYGETVTSSFHTGIDYAVPEGTPILASASGTVVFAGWNDYGWGKMVILSHSSSRATVYAHLSSVNVTLGQKVMQGEQLGLSGNTGNTTGPHLHFEARTQWANYRTHIDPKTLPLMTMAGEGTARIPSQLKSADSFKEGDILTIVAPLGAKAFRNDLFDYYTPYPKGSNFHYTGQALRHNGYTYLQVIPLARPVWIAVNDDQTQILDKKED